MRPRTNISLRLAIALVATTCSAIGIVACSSDDDRAAFDLPKDDGGSANLPDSGPELEASAPTDAGSDKPPFDPKDEAVTCAGPTCAVQIVAGENHFCARMSDGTVRCWGDNEKGQLGVVDAPTNDPDAGDAGSLASRVMDLEGATYLSASGTTTCALVADGGAVCWGGNEVGQLGLTVSPPTSDGDSHPTPSPVALNDSIERLDVGQTSSCAVLASGETWCWGDNAQKQLARTTETDIGGPAKAELGTLNLARTAAGTNTGFGISVTGDVFSWGALGGPEGLVAARVASISPDPLPLAIELASVTSLSVSSTTFDRPRGGGGPRPPPRAVAHACAVTKGEVYCWGVSLMGALGTGLPEPSIEPLKAFVTSEKGWPQQVAAAGDITCVRLTDGTVQCTGDNSFGVLGKDPRTDPFSMFFRPVPTFSGYAVQVAAASRTACALVKDGSVLCWGSNGRGELGRGTVDGEPHPTPVSIRF